VGVNAYSLHHNEDHFVVPFRFSLERWLLYDIPEKRATRQAMLDSFRLFCVGAHACARKLMACYLETSQALAKTLWYFDFEPVPGAVGLVGAGKKGAVSGRESDPASFSCTIRSPPSTTDHG
jgi:hypothetical protein